MWILIPVLFTIFLHCNGSDVENLFYNYHQLYEGSRCQLRNGAGEGVCAKAIDCPGFIQQLIQNGDLTGVNRCGFDNFDEIVCCAPKRSFESRNEIRPAEAACQKHIHSLKEMNSFAPVIIIFNGVPAMEQEFPHMAALGYPVSRQEAAGGVEYACGGTLISQKHVLTAAHCVSNIYGLIPNQVVFGTNDLDYTKAAGVQRIPISRIIKHPKFKRGLNYHDIAILELEESVKFTPAVFPMCLMTEPLTRKNANRNTSLSIIGWGGIDIDGTTSTKLLKAEKLKFVNKKRCCKRYAHVRANIPNGLDNAMICVRDPDTERRADTCPGDSGGPLIIETDQFPRVVGVTSFGYPCGGTEPGVYASVYKYLDWIEDKVWPKSE